MTRPAPVARRQALIDARESAGVTAVQLAAQIGIRRDSLLTIESGQRHPSFALMVRWAGALGVSLSVWDLEEEPKDKIYAAPSYLEWTRSP
jgi:transcriptional regulator with XRE-family HTH domain